MNKTIIPSEKQTALICEEVLGKINQYETRMMTRLARWTEIAELYCGKTATQKENSKNSPNSTELFKAIRAEANMIVRMLLGQKPCFSLDAMDILGHSDPSKLIKAEHYISNQMDLSRFDKATARAVVQLLLYGSVAEHMQYEPLRGSFLGHKRWITSCRPVSLVNCAFALDAYDIEESSWVALSDIQNKTVLDRLIEHDPNKQVYNHRDIHAAKAESDYAPHVNTWVNQRMAWQGYINGNFNGGMERITYYGPLDCMHDTEEYCVEVVNRRFVVRLECYEGIRPVSVTTINTIDVEPLGNGLGDMFRSHLGLIDDTKSSLLNTITLAGANMFAKQKSLTEEDAEFSIRNFGILALENPALTSVSPNPQTVGQLAGYLSNQIQEFRQAAGAPDTLQALVTDDQATATAVSLSMNEAVRNLSVMAQMAAPTLIQHYAKMCLQNAQKYNTEPFVLNIKGVPISINPSDLLIDVDVKIKTTTDQDFRPAKIKNLMSAAQLMLSTPPNALNGKKIDPTDTIVEILKLLDVPNWDKAVTDVTDEDMLKMRMMAEMQNPQAQGEQEEGVAQEERAQGERPGIKEQRNLGKNMRQPMAEGVHTPVGQVLAAPGDNASTVSAIRSSSATGGNE